MNGAADISTRSRIAAPDEGIGLDELALAARNHGIPLGALRYDLTPAGLHYRLVHYDIPVVDPDTWRLRLDGALREPVELDLAALRARPRAAGDAADVVFTGADRGIERGVSAKLSWAAIATWQPTPTIRTRTPANVVPAGRRCGSVVWWANSLRGWTIRCSS